MVAVLKEQPHFEVPARIREEGSPADHHTSRLQLADRIAGLPGILTVDNGPEALPCSVTVYLQRDQGPARKRQAPMTLCVIGRDGMAVHGLSLSDRRHLVAQGWAMPVHDHVQVFLPRNSDEVDVCWTVLQHAHSSLLDFSVRSFASRHALQKDLPRFSRTTLQ